jgi:hypothetical protein
MWVGTGGLLCVRFRPSEGSHQGPTATPTVCTLPSVLSTTFHCACVYSVSRSWPGSWRATQTEVMTLQLGWDGGEVGPLLFDGNSSSPIRDPVGRILDLCPGSHRCGAFLMRGNLPLVHRVYTLSQCLTLVIQQTEVTECRSPL